MEKRRWSGRIFGGLGIFLMTVTFALPAWGQELEWIIQAGGSQADFGSGIAIDGEGNSYVTGAFNGTATFGIGESNETELLGFGDEDAFLAKYAGDGGLIWAKQAGTSRWGVDIAIDEEGNSYVTGAFQGTATFGPGESNETELTVFGIQDIFVAKYASDGSLLWARQVGGSFYDEPGGIAVDGEGNSYVVGFFFGILAFVEEGNGAELTSLGSGDTFLAKYAGDGSLLWVRQAGGSGRVDGNAVAVDEEGNSYLTGSFSGTVAFGIGDTNETELTSFGEFGDIFLAKYASDGRLLRVMQDGDSLYAIGRDIAIDEEGNSYLTGSFLGPATFGAGESNETALSGFGAEDIFVSKYASDGSLLWASQAGGSHFVEGQPDFGVDIGHAIAVDGDGNSFVTGEFSSTATFGIGEVNETELTSFGGRDVFVAKYAGDGSLLWVTHGGGEWFDNGHGIAVDGEGKSYVTGNFGRTSVFGDTILEGFDEYDIFVAKYADGTPSNIGSLIDLVESFELSRGIENSLLAKLRNARRALESGGSEQRQNAVNILQAFINEVEAQRGNQLAQEQADQLIDGAWEIITAL